MMRQRPDARRRRIFSAALVLTLVGAAVSAQRLASHGRAPADPVRLPVVEPFSLRDAEGRLHTLSDWRDSRAVVLFLIGAESPAARQAAAELRRVAELYRSLEVAFFGVQADPAVGAAVVARFAREQSLQFPILLDPAQELTADLGLGATPAAALLDGQGHLLYSGSTTAPSALEAAIAAVLAGAAPPTARTEATGDPLPRPAPLVGPDQAITFHADVAPILWRHCAGCHRPGEVGPFPLLTHRDAAKRAAFLSEVAASRQMPPWRAVHGYGDFEGPGRLSRRELAMLARWAERGAPQGDPASAPQPPTFPGGWQLGRPDLVVTMPEAYAVPAGVGDDFRSFVLPLGLEHDVAVAAVEFRPGNRRIVHHARFYVDATDECRRLDAAEPGPGYVAFESGGAPIIKPGLAAWVPGQIPRLPPPDVGRVVRKGSDLVVLIHYHGTGKHETDRSSVGLYLCKTPPRRQMLHIPLSTKRIDIAPGARRHRIALSYRVAADAHALSLIPHGHKLLREISLTAVVPEGKVVPLVWIDDWDFNWQGQYHFARPVALPEGTRLDLVAYYDNSAENPSNPFRPPRRVRYGDTSDAEMLGCHVQIVADDAAAERVLKKKLPQGL
jgi:peroxiredoxin